MFIILFSLFSFTHLKIYGVHRYQCYSLKVYNFKDIFIYIYS